MGVHGLWKLIEPSGRVVPLESMAHKVLAVDVSIWLHQAMKGMHDVHGAPISVAHLLVLFHRLCKLLFYKIKPVFVFDGGVPALKKQTMAARRTQSNTARSEAQKVRGKLLKNLLKHEAVRQVLSNEAATAALGLSSFTLPGPAEEEDLYKLPPIATDAVESNSPEESSLEEDSDEKHVEDIHSIDVKSAAFLALPADVRHDILTEMKDTRKQSSWKHLDQMPKNSDEFSGFQMNRLLKRYAVQKSLDEAGKEMGGKAMSLKELEELLEVQGVINVDDVMQGKRIAQDSVTRYVLIHKDQGGEFSNKESNVVDWSSASDTEFAKLKEEGVDDPGLSEDELSQQQIYDLITKEVLVSPVKFEDQTKKIRLPQDIIEILTVLEDEDDVKQSEEITLKTNVPDINVKNEKPEVVNVEENVEVVSPMVAKHEEPKVIPISKDKISKKSPEVPLDGSITPVNAHKDHDRVEMEARASSLATMTEPSSIEVDTNKILSVMGNAANSVESETVVSEPNVPPVNEDITPTVESGIVHNLAKASEFVDNISNIIKEESEENVVKPVTAVKNDDVNELEELKELSKLAFSTSESQIVNNASSTPVMAEQNPSSSDSDDELVPIVDEPSQVTGKNSGKVEEKMEESKLEENKSLEIVFNPSVQDETEDIFADIFKPKSKLPPPEKKDDIFAAVEVSESSSESEPDRNINEFEQMTETDLLKLQKSIENEQDNLLAEQGRKERQAQTVTEQMYLDAQELLRLFGVPFVVAPMEAEAQCAILDAIGLTEGTITDDSDIWLFGGRVVYKNFFNQKKHVLEYRSEDIHKYFKLSREEMIKLAMLVGSDYTPGLNGIGPVTALEILAAFPTSKQGEILTGLQRFKEWVTSGFSTGPPRASLKNKIKNTAIIPGFPSGAVVQAYMNPEVDDSREAFSWAKPNVTLLQSYARIKFGWPPSKCNELLMPVMKRLLDNAAQTTMEKFFRTAPKPSLTEGVLSKRVERAVKRLGCEHSSSESDQDAPKPKKTRSRKPKVVKETQHPSSSTTSRAKPNSNRIKERLHREIKIPQKESTQKMLEERKKRAVEIFKTCDKKAGNKRRKIIVEKEVKLSESSSDD